jgi:expansin
VASPSHRRSRGPRRPLSSGPRRPLLLAGALAAVVLLASLVVAVGSEKKSGGSGSVAVAPGATGGTPTAPDRESATPPGAAPSSPAAASSAASPSATPTRTADGTAAPTATGAPAGPSTAPASRSVPSDAALAGRIRPGVTYRGLATTYDASGGEGSCSFGAGGTALTAAMNTTDYESARACGAYVRVATADGAAVTVLVTNECPTCEAGQLDLSEEAFTALADLGRGRISVSWSLLSPASAAPLSVRYKTGSSSYWCGLQVLGHRNPVARLEVAAGGGWTRLERTGYNYFLSEQGTGCGGRIRITDIYGEQLTVGALAVRPDAVQSAGVQFAPH